MGKVKMVNGTQNIAVANQMMGKSPSVAHDVESPTAPKFSEVYEQIQAKYGERPEKPREIKKTLGKDDFLKIMITQMRHQDPTSPFKPDQMAAQMAQFASVEQMQNMNQNIQKMATQNSPLEKLAMTNMIGKVVTVDRERFSHTEGQPDALSFVLPKDAKEVRVALLAENGETVFAKELGALRGGPNSFTWDGNQLNTLPAKAGTYMLRIEAQDDNGQSLNTNAQTQARIIGISFEGSEPVFLIGDAKRQDKITLRNIVKVETDGALAQGSPGIQALPAQNAKNFFAFQKGVGSQNLEAAKAAPEVRAALAQFEAQSEKGFPNGLQDNDEVAAVTSDNNPLDSAKGGEEE